MSPKKILEKLLASQVKEILNSEYFWHNIFQDQDDSHINEQVKKEVNSISCKTHQVTDIRDNESISVSISNI